MFSHWSICSLNFVRLRRVENDSKQSDEFQASQFDVARETGLVLCRIPLWDGFNGLLTLFPAQFRNSK